MSANWREIRLSELSYALCEIHFNPILERLFTLSRILVSERCVNWHLRRGECIFQIVEKTASICNLISKRGGLLGVLSVHFFAGHCGHLFLSPILPMNQLLFLHKWVPAEAPPSQVLVRVECRDWYSSLREVPACIAVSIFPNRGEGRVLVRPKMHLSREVCVWLLAAPCRTLLEIGGHLQCEFTSIFFRNCGSRGEIQPNSFYASLRSEFIKRERERTENEVWKWN